MRGILPFRLKKTNLLLRLCEDPLSTGHSEGTKKNTENQKKSKFFIIIFMFICLRRCCDKTTENFLPEIYPQFEREIPTLIHGSEPLNLKQMMNRSVFYSIAHRHNIIVMLQVGHMKQHI